MVFSKPANYSQAWQLQNEPRYFHQYIRQHLPSIMPVSARQDHDEVEEQDQDRDDVRRGPAHNRPRTDWTVPLGANAFMGAGQFPAKFTFDVNAPVTVASCTADYVAYTTSRSGTLQIVGFDNLYTSQGGALPAGFCGTNGPSVMWAYDTRLPGGGMDTTGTTLTSPVVSLDGTKVAYVESRTIANGGAILQILKWKSGQGIIAAPVAPDTRLAAGQNWTTNCPAANSCVRSIVLNGVHADTNSSPFYNYATDELYVGDDAGLLHKFTGVFLGTPAEVVVVGGWPFTVDAGAVLTAPVLDFTSRNIFVGDSTGRLSFVRETGSVGACSGGGSPPCLASVSQALGGSILDPPVVDGATGRVLVFDGTEAANRGSVFQFDIGLTTASKVTVPIGGTATVPPTDLAFNVLHAGTFDDAYFSSGPGFGHFYTCGKDPGFNNRPAIFRLAFDNAGVLNAAAGTPLTNLSTNFSLIGDACSPVTEIKNGATDRIFFSFAVNANPPSGGGTATGCTAGQGCVVSVVLGGLWPPAATTAGRAIPFIITGGTMNHAGIGGTSGIVVDNVGAGAQESSIYYTLRTNSTAAITCSGTPGVGCAVKVTQSALR